MDLCAICRGRFLSFARITGVREQLRCPRSNPAVPEVLCGNGRLEFHEGYWHDGLEPSHPSLGQYSSFLSRGEPMPLQMRFYSCPYRGANRLPSACTFPNSRTGELVCARNTAGPLCALCLPNHFHKESGCESCEDVNQLPWNYIVVALIVLGWVAYRLWKHLRAEASHKTANWWQGVIRRLRPIVKQMVSALNYSARPLGPDAAALLPPPPHA